jgi:hypothetical protein
MKQLLNINDTIQTLTKKHGVHMRQTKSISGYRRRCVASCILPIVTDQTMHSSTGRRMSVPIMEDSMGSSSSLEGNIINLTIA